MSKQPKPDASLLMWTHLNELDNDRFRWSREIRFHPTRRWRFDFVVTDPSARPMNKLAIEIDGGSWINGRHNTGSGSEKDREKFNEAARLGWRVLKFTPKEVLDGSAIAFIRKVLEAV